MKRFLIILSVLLLFVYFGLKIILYRTTFENRNQVADNYPNLTRQDIKLKTGEVVDVVFSKKDDDIVFVYFHGNIGRLPYIVNFLQSKYSLVAPSYPGYSLSTGKPEKENVYETVEKTRDFVRENFPDRKIYAIGHSLGSQSAIYYGTIEPKIDTLAIVAGFDSVISLCKERLKQFAFACFVANDSFNAGLQAKQSQFPFNFISFHNPYDKVIPLDRGLALYEDVNAKDKTFFKLTTGDHGNFDIELTTKMMLLKAQY
jgi:pimeloyl-ACP methyl ester carboxylesterase